MLNILFLHKDPQARRALEDSVASKRGEWNMYFAADAKSVLSDMESLPIDVMVADFAAARQDSFVERVRESYPDVVRIALVDRLRSGRSGLSNFHQFLLFPFAMKELDVAVERSCRLRDLLRGEAMSLTVGAIGQLPSAPKVYMKLVEKLDQPDTSVDEVADIIQADVAISAKLLQLVNSALFRTSGEIATVTLAVSYLGLTVIRNLVLSTEVFRFFEDSPKMDLFSIEELQKHSQLTAKIAGELDLDKENRETAIVASLLHDVGKLVLAWKMPDRLIRLLAKAEEQERPLYQVEEELSGITHADIGACLLGLWGLPISITEAVAYHHAPEKVPHYRFDALAAVYVANLLAHEHSGRMKKARVEWNIPLLEKMGVAGNLPKWRELAKGIQI